MKKKLTGNTNTDIHTFLRSERKPIRSLQYVRGCLTNNKLKHNKILFIKYVRKTRVLFYTVHSQLRPIQYLPVQSATTIKALTVRANSTKPFQGYFPSHNHTPLNLNFSPISRKQIGKNEPRLVVKRKQNCYSGNSPI